MDNQMELDIWKGDWGLVSVDLDCIRLATLCKFSGAAVQLNVKKHPWSAPGGRLPVFRHHKRMLCSYEAVASYLHNKNLSTDFGLTEKEKADVVAITMFLKEHLYPALLYTWWVDERNRIGLSRKWFCKTLPFPLNFWYPDQFQKAAEKAIEGLFPNIKDPQVLETEIYDRGMQCVVAMSHRLGTQEFVFGSHPTSIDATLYAYLAPLVKIPFPNTKFKNQVLSHSNIVKYVTRISQRYFAAELQAYETQRLQEHVQTSGSQSDSFPHKRRNQLLAVGFAVVAMAGYAISTGLVQVPIYSIGGGAHSRTVYKAVDFNPQTEDRFRLSGFLAVHQFLQLSESLFTTVQFEGRYVLMCSYGLAATER